MILKRALIILGIIIITCIVGAGLILLGNMNKENNRDTDIYEENGIDSASIEVDNKTDNDNLDENTSNHKEIDSEDNSVTVDNNLEQTENEEPIITNNEQNNNVNVPNNSTTNSVENNVPSDNNEQGTNENNSNNDNNTVVENTPPAQETPKEDVYTSKRNDSEINNMISIAKRLIRENKDNRYSGLVDNVDNINFVIEKSGDVFYPLYESRIANIVMDNYYPEFYVYAEDIYKNGEYVRTEYYFQ